MKYIFFIAAFNALFFILQLLPKKNKTLYDRILIIWLLYLGISTVAYALSTHELFANTQIIFNGLIAGFMLNGPFIYLYIYVLVLKKEYLNKIDYLHFLPFFIFLSYLLISGLFPNYAKYIRLDHVSSDGEPPFLFIFFLLLTAISGPFYILLSVKLFKRLDINIFTNLSYSDEINLRWLRILVYSFGIVWTVLIIVTIIHHVFQLFSMFFCIDGLFLSLSAFVILMGYFGLRQKDIILNHPDLNLELTSNAKNKYAGSSLKEDDSLQYLDKLNRYMEIEKPFLDSNLTLTKLAKELNIPLHHLSQLINEKTGLNFFDFINRYRIEAVKAKMTDSKFANFSLLGIAFDCGFNSKSAFNRVFKKLTGVTPSKYKEQISNFNGA